MGFVNIRKDGSEKVTYDYEDYYAYVRRGFLSYYPNYAAASHWHDDLEFIYILSGTMQYNVNGKIINIEQGNGILVNSRQLHYGFSYTKEECDFICILLHPMLLCNSQSIDRNFVTPILSDSSIPYILLQQNVAWQKSILDNIYIMYEYKDVTTAPLYIQNAFYTIWILLTENMTAPPKTPAKQNHKLSILKNMLSFIQKNYNKKISLENIASAGNVSKSTCLSIFKTYLKDTPTNHLIGYRLKKATTLLEESNLSILEVALSVGFPSVSYFTKTFHKSYNCTPSEYRNKKSSRANS